MIGKPDLERGAIIKAYVVLKSQYEASEELAAELKTHVRNRLSTHAFPREIEFMLNCQRRQVERFSALFCVTKLKMRRMRNRAKDETAEAYA